MSEQTTTPEPQGGGGPRRSRWPLVIGIGLVLAAGGHYLWTSYEPRPPVVLGENPEPIEIGPDFRAVDTLPVERGALAGGNVLLVTMDTTRADRIGCYGNEDIETPVLDRLAHEGAIFSQATATAPTTLPSHTSILTGLYPSHHGSRANGLYRLSDSQVTLAEVLAGNGYATGAVISAYVLDSRFGLAQGFDHYDDDLSDCEPAAPYRYQERKGDKTTARALAWLQGVADGPFFLWVHYFDPHAVYEPPSPYAEQYKANPYDGEIAFVDAQIGKLIDGLDALGLTDWTLIVVVGDHGESLGQHNEWTHAFLTYEATLRVPLILRCGNRFGGVHIPRRVSQVDIMPTVLSLLGLDGPDRTDGVDLTARKPGPRPIFSETVHGLLVFGWAALLAVYDGPYKYIHGPCPELFDVTKDPHESRDLYESRPGTAARLKQKLCAFFGPDLELTDVAPPTETLSLSDLEKLGALGYAGAVANIPAPASRPDPKAMMPALHQVERIMYTQDFASALDKKIELLEELTDTYPDFHPAFRFLGDTYRLNGEPAKAAEAYARCIELCPDPTTLYGLALTKLYQGESAAAGALLREIVSKYPDHVPARYFLGVLAGQEQRYDEAAEQFKSVFDIDPDFELPGMPPCGIQLVQVYVLAGRADELPGMLRPRLEANPRSAAVRVALTAYYASRKQHAEAEALLREGLALAPGNPVLISNLAMFLVGCPDPSVRKPFEGLAMMERLCEATAYADPEPLSTLSVLYSMVGRAAEGIALAERAKELATKAGNQTLVQGLTELLAQQREAQEGGRRPVPLIFPGER